MMRSGNQPRIVTPWLGGLLACCLGGGEALSAEQLMTEAEFFGELPVVVSATRLSQPRNETPAAVTVIDRELIEASGAIEFVDLLRLVPGFQVAAFNGNLSVLSAHGTGAPWFARVQVLVDGQSNYHTAFSGLEWAHLGVALEDIERIEVVRGGNIPSYGANAVQGTINIITRHPAETQGLSAQATVGSRDTGNGFLRYGGRAGVMDYRLSAEYRENDGFPGANDHTRLHGLGFRGIANPSERDELDIHLGFQDSRFGVQMHFPYEFGDRELRTDYQFLRWTRSLDQDQAFFLQFSRDHYDSDEDSRLLVSDWFGVDPTLVPSITGGEPDQYFSFNHFNVEGDRYNLELQHDLRPRDDLRLAWGAGYRWDRWWSQLLDRDDRVSGYSGRLFGTLEWRPWEQLVVNLGAMWEQTRLTGSTLSPRLGLNYHLNPQQTLRVAISRAHKSPSLHEEYWRTMLRLDNGDPLYLWMESEGDLDPEVRDLVEIGYQGNWFDGGLQLDLRLYHETIRDAVIYGLDLECPQPLVPGLCYRVGNLMSYDANGLELELAYRPWSRGLARLSYAYADLDGDAAYSVRPPQDYGLARTAPRHSGSLLLQQGFGAGWQASLVWYHQGETDWYVDGDRVPGYDRVDLRLAREIRLPKADATLELLVHNLGDEYLEFAERNRFGTRGFLRLGVRFR